MIRTIIIGNGIAGVSVAMRMRREGCQDGITLISSESPSFFSRTALMYIFMGHMKEKDTRPYEESIWAEQRIDRVLDRVDSVNFKEKHLTLTKGTRMAYDRLVLAVGSVPNRFGWPGQNLRGVQSLYHLQDLETLERDIRHTHSAVIVGGGLIGIELAEMLLSRRVKVTFLVREQRFWNSVLPDAEAELVGRQALKHGVDLRFGEELDSIEDDGTGRVGAIVTKSGERIEAQLVGLTIGVRPNVEFLKDSGLELDRGILVDEHFRANQEGVYAVGDCAQFRKPLPGRRPLEQVWYTGKMQGETLGARLAGKDLAYQPGIWFNSAKFFDIEYQTYGMLPAKPAEGHESFYWEHPDGEISLRIYFESATHKVVAFNFFGLRARHALCEGWISEGWRVEQVLEQLGACNFDPEFYKQYEAGVIQDWNEQHPDQLVKLKTGKGLWSKLLRKWMRGAA